MRKDVLNQINSLNLSMFHARHKTLSETNLNKNLTHLISFKDILTKIKFTVEILSLIKIILSFLSTAAFIPIFVLSIYLFIRKIILLFSVLFTSSFTATYLNYYSSNLNNFNNILGDLKLSIKNLTIQGFNYIFDEDLISRKDIISIKILQSSNNWMTKIYDYIYNHIPYSSMGIDWILTGYISAGIIASITIYYLYFIWARKNNNIKIQNIFKVVFKANNFVIFVLSYLTNSSGPELLKLGSDDDSDNPRDNTTPSLAVPSYPKGLTSSGPELPQPPVAPNYPPIPEKSNEWASNNKGEGSSTQPIPIP